MVKPLYKNKILVKNFFELKKSSPLEKPIYLKLNLDLFKYKSLLQRKRAILAENNWRLWLFKNKKLRKVLFKKISLRRKHLLKIKKRNKKRPTVKKTEIGILYLRRGKRNIYLTLCNLQNQVKASLSAGYLKFKGVKLKSKARKAMYNLKKLAHILVGLILRLKLKKLHLKFKTSFPPRVKKTFLRIISYKRKKFKICKLSRFRSKPHNGCRRPKIRRK